MANVSEKASLYRYGSDKWTVKEVVGHISDTERVMAYRVLLPWHTSLQVMNFTIELFSKNATCHIFHRAHFFG